MNKSCFLYQKGSANDTHLARLTILHHDNAALIVKYAHVPESELFIQTLRSQCQQMQLYRLTNARHLSLSDLSEDYLVLGINDVAKMIYFAEKGDHVWIADHKLELLAPRNFYLNWDKQGKFIVEWS